MIFELYIEDLTREINILNYYKGEAVKRKDIDAVLMQTAEEQHDALLYHIRSAVTDVLELANPKALKFTCDYKDDRLVFDLTPIREGMEHIISILKEAVRQYIVYEVRRLWLMLVRPDMAEYAQRGELIERIQKSIRQIGKGERLRRRCTDLAGI